MEMGNIREALNTLERTLHYSPDHPGAREDLVKAKRILARLETQIEALRNEEDPNPDDLQRYLQLGDLLIVVGRPEEAIRTYQRALTLAPDHQESLHGLSWAYMQTKEYEKALTVLKQLSALSPGQAVIDYNISCAYGRAQRPKESITWLKTALEKGYDNWRRIRSDDDLDPIRQRPEFRSLMQTYFSGKDLEG